MSEQNCGCVKQPCGCCEGVQQLTPANECNRPGLDSISYRAGTHGQFLASMKARLSTMEVEGVGSDAQTIEKFRPLQSLTTRDTKDFSIALLDSWATVGDVLSFYQERIANEGYLRTATERRSVLEMANLVGYTLRPGVASTVYLAYTIDDKQLEPVTIPLLARSQSIPGPGDLPQSFETSDVLEARASWNTFTPRMSRPQTVESIHETSTTANPLEWHIYLTGTATGLKPNDPLLIDFGDGNLKPTPFRVTEVAPEPALNRTVISFTSWGGNSVPDINSAPGLPSAAAAAMDTAKVVTSDKVIEGRNIDPAISLMKQLTSPPSIPPRNTLTLARDLKSTFTPKADIGAQMVTNFIPALKDVFGLARSGIATTPKNGIHVYALRTKAAPFGNTAPLKITSTTPTVHTEEWKHKDMGLPISVNGHANNSPNEIPNAINLDASYDKILPGSWLVIDTSAVDWNNEYYIQRATQGGSVIVAPVQGANAGVSHAAYGMSGKSTKVEFGKVNGTQVEWFKDGADTSGVVVERMSMRLDNSFQLIRRTAVYVQSEELQLADEPISEPICKGGDSWIELDGYYSDLKSGRWVIVSGDRADVTTADPDGSVTPAIIPGVHGSELLMLSNVVHAVALPDGTPMTQATFGALPGEKLHTFIKFAKNLKYCYSRDKVTVYGNVVKATHGETRNETLGNGDGSKVLQSFTLKQPPLTFVAAPTSAGADSTLKAYVNDVEWHEKDSLALFGAKDHVFATSTDDAGHTTLTFGNGEHGARLPTGLLNVTAKYRNGIGRVGNVRAEQISLLQSRPLGVKAVINPLRASGGADKESRDLARENAPLSVMPLDRLVSVQDYADFTRRFAGIAKALAQKTSDGRRELIYLTIAGVDDAPIDASSDLYRNLLDALRLHGDPDLPLRVDVRELKMLVLSANIKILPDYLWEPVVNAVRTRLLDTFGFAKRGLGQWALLSEVISEIQSVRGVAYVDVDKFGAIPEKVADTSVAGTPIRRLQTPDEIITTVQLIIDPDSMNNIDLGSRCKILNARAAKDRLPEDVTAWAGGSDNGMLRPAELVIFSPAVPDTLILNQIS